MADRQLYVLGPVRVECAGVPIQGFESRKAVALLCYLALLGQPQTRAHLAELFWEGKPEERGRGNLNRVLHNLSTLVPGCLEITRQTIGVVRGGLLWLDAAAFEVLTSQGDAGSLAGAAQLYRGDLLADLQLDDCPEFAQWLEGTREHWRQRQMQVLHRLLQWHVEQGSTSEGIAWATQMLRIDPWHEEAYRALMRLLAQSGQRSAALAQYDACRRVLAADLGIEPEAATTALYEAIRDGSGQPWTDAQPAPQPPAMRPLARHRDLPTPTTSFVDRQAELALVLARLADPACRLLTLVGPGGVGKSRLALEAALQLASANHQDTSFAHGIVFVPLAAVEACAWNEVAGTEAAAIHALATSIARALTMAFVGPDAPQIQLLAYLREKQLLLTLDNCEQLLAATGFIAQLLHQAPGLKILVTSQVRLHLHGEHIVELGGLDFPGRQAAPGQAGYEHYSAITLFVQRARAVLPRFALTPANQAAVVRIVQLVDGLPLGIELAASWVRMLPCQEIASEIMANLGFLQSSRRDIPRRQRSLQAVFDYAWTGLTVEARRVLCQLSVFRGGFEREAARYVAGASLSLLAALLDSSLVRCASADSEDGLVRYELLEVVRQYAAEKLAEAAWGAPAEADAVYDRQATYYMAFLRQRTDDLRGGRQQAALAEIQCEIENIRVSWCWAMAHNRIDAIDQALESLFHFYDMRSWFQEGAGIFAQATAWLAEKPASERSARRVWGRALARQGWFTFHIGRQAQACMLLSQSLEILRAVGTPADLIFPLHHLAAALAHLGAYIDARSLCLEGLAISETLGDRYGIAISKTVFSQIVAPQGQYLEARHLCQASLAIDREIGNLWGMAFSLMNLGTAAYALREHQEAQIYFEECLAIRESLGDARGIALCFHHLGDTALALANYPEAQRHYQCSLAMFKEIGNQLGVAATLTKLGYNELALGKRVIAWEYFRDALQTAWSAQAIPSALDALVGCAILSIGTDPHQAYMLAALIQLHPSAMQETRDRASEVLANLLAPDSAAMGAAAQQQLDAQALNDAVAIVLRNDHHLLVC